MLPGSKPAAEKTLFFLSSSCYLIIRYQESKRETWLESGRSPKAPNSFNASM